MAAFFFVFIVNVTIVQQLVTIACEGTSCTSGPTKNILLDGLFVHYYSHCWKKNKGLLKQIHRYKRKEQRCLSVLQTQHEGRTEVRALLLAMCRGLKKKHVLPRTNPDLYLYRLKHL